MSSSSNGTSPWWYILLALLRKNFLILRAAPMRCVCIISIPALSLLLIDQIQGSINSFLNPTSTTTTAGGTTTTDISTTYYALDDTPLQQCQWFDIYGSYTNTSTSDCLTVAYVPASSSSSEEEEHRLVDKIMSNVASESSLEIYPMIYNFDDEKKITADVVSFQYDVVGFATTTLLATFMKSHPGRVSGVVLFRSPITETQDDIVIDMLYNTSSPNDPLQLQRMQASVAKAVVATTVNATTIDVTTRVKDFASLNHELQTPSEAADDAAGIESQSAALIIDSILRRIVGAIAGVIITVAYAIVSMLILLLVNRECHQGLMGALRSVGVADSLLWASWFITALVINSVNTALLVAVAQSTAVFSTTIVILSDTKPPIVLYTILLSTAMAIYSLLCLIVAFFNRPKAVIGIFGVMFFVLAITSGISATPDLRSPTSLTGAIFGWIFPSFHLQTFMMRMGNFANESVLTPSRPVSYNAYDVSYFNKGIGRCIYNSSALASSDDGQVLTCAEEIPLLEIPRDKQEDFWFNDGIEYIDCKSSDTLEFYNNFLSDMASANESDRMDDYGNPKYWHTRYECALEDWYYVLPSEASVLLSLLLQCGTYVLLTWYVFNIVSSGNGKARSPWFCFSYTYWTSSISKRLAKLEKNIGFLSDCQKQSLVDKNIQIDKICKNFKSFKAVTDVSMSIPRGQVVVLLGHNGAGKTTLMNMLTGKTNVSSGSAYISGLSVTESDIELIQQITGIVPQHDLLWGELSGLEHIQLYDCIKNYNGGASSYDKILSNVQLVDAQNLAAGRYSGGMKRRLSIALSGIGNPSVVLMDEPTTGIDPYNRRRIWKLVEELKKDRIVFLTTHAMEEADVLGDYIAVMDAGSIQASGTSLNLKNKYGKGYTVTSVISSEHLDYATSVLNEIIKPCGLESKGNDTYTFSVSKEREEILPTLTKALDTTTSTNNTKVFREWTISLSSLEDVFLALAAESKSSTSSTTSNSTKKKADDDAVVDIKEDTENDNDNDLSNGMRIQDILQPPTMIQQVKGHLLKMLRLQKFQRLSNLCQLFFPVLFFVGLSYLQTTLIEPEEYGDTSVKVLANAYIEDDSEWLVDSINIENVQSLSVDLSNCDFQWKFLSRPKSLYDAVLSTSGIDSILNSHTEFKLPGNTGNFVLSSRMTVTNDNESSYKTDALNNAIQSVIDKSLSRTKSAGNQSLANEYCASLETDFAVCAPCVWRSDFELEILKAGEYYDVMLKTKVREFSFDSKVSGGIRTTSNVGGSVGQSYCSAGYNACSANVMRQVFATTDENGASFATRVADILNTTMVTLSPLKASYDNPLESNLKTDVSFIGRGSVDSLHSSWYDYYPELMFNSLNGSLWVSGSTEENVELLTRYFNTSFKSVVNVGKTVSDLNTRVVNAQYSMKDSDEVDLNLISPSGYLNSSFNWSYCKAQLYNFHTFRSQDDPFIRSKFMVLDPKPTMDRDSNRLFDAFSDRFPVKGMHIDEFSITSGDDNDNKIITLKLDVYDYLKKATQPGGYFGDIIIPYFHTTIIDPFCQTGNAECTPEDELKCFAISASEQWYKPDQDLAWRGSSSDNDNEIVEPIGFTEALMNTLWKLINIMQSNEVNSRKLRFQTYQPSSRLNLGALSYRAAISMWDLAFCTISILSCTMVLFPTIVWHLKTEKEERFLLLMQINNVKMASYYVSMFLYYAIFGFTAYVVTLVIGYVAGSKPLLDADITTVTYLLILGLVYQYVLFGTALVFSVIPLPRRLMTALCLLVVMASVFAPLFIIHPSFTSTENFQKLDATYYFIPPVSLARAIFLSAWGGGRNVNEIWEICGMFVIVGTLYGGFGILVSQSTGIGATLKFPSFKKHSAKVKNDDVMNDDKMLAEMYEDVVAERKVALNAPPENNAIVIRNLSKTFKNKIAVNNLCLSMHYGECFGLLGPNGAGKTTTMSMIVGQFPPSSGEIYVNGFNTETQSESAMRSLGIVPQFDVLYDDLTVKEHLEFYASLKGVKTSHMSAWCESVASSVSLLNNDLYRRQSRRLSGGMKRRLSIAIALISDPATLFLDEPTTGLDPEIKRSVWGVISKLKRRKKCIVLTTHGMDEAEALCDRIGIMTKGSLRCVASVTRLRRRFGTVVQLSFNFNLSLEEKSDESVINAKDLKLKEFVKTYDEGATLQSSYGPTRVYSVPKDNVKDMSSLFAHMQKGVSTGLYTEWEISQTSLDEVFCSIAAESEES